MTLCTDIPILFNVSLRTVLRVLKLDLSEIPRIHRLYPGLIVHAGKLVYNASMRISKPLRVAAGPKLDGPESSLQSKQSLCWACRDTRHSSIRPCKLGTLAWQPAVSVRLREYVGKDGRTEQSPPGILPRRIHELSTTTYHRNLQPRHWHARS